MRKRIGFLVRTRLAMGYPFASADLAVVSIDIQTDAAKSFPRTHPARWHGLAKPGIHSITEVLHGLPHALSEFAKLPLGQ